MKLSDVNYQTEEAKQVEITDHNGKSFTPKALISVLPWKSRIGSSALIEMQREMMALRTNKKDDESIDEKIRESSISALSKLVIGWENIEDEKGKPLKFTSDNVKALIGNQYITDIVDRFCSNLGNFLIKQVNPL